MKIYLPDTDYACFYMINDHTIRAYDNQPRLNSSTTYTDYYLNTHYLYTNGTQSWGSYNTLPFCMGSEFTTNVMYRNDISEIMITFFILLLICFYFPYRIISRAFGRWLKW